MVIDDEGQPRAPGDLTPPLLDPARLESQFRKRRLTQRLEHGPIVSDNDSLDEGSESDVSDDESSPVGFHFAEGCTHRCALFHNMVWLRYEIARRVRARVLQVMKNEEVDNEVGRDFILDVVVGGDDEDENELTRKYDILPELRRLTNKLLSQAKGPEF
jgi:hypothetical protein